jgi:hypothetical protein
MDKRVEQKLIQNIDALTPGGQTAIVLCAGAFRFGGNWGFIKRSKADFNTMLDTLKQERPNVKAIAVANGALIMCDENFLAHNVNLAVPNAINGSFVEMSNKRRTDERQRFGKFIDNVAKGKSSHVKNAKGFRELTLGVFCVNDTNAIRLNGIDYPAYKLTLLEALDAADKLSALGNKVYARAIKKDGEEVFDLIFNLATNSEGLAALYRGLEIADSDTGLFLTLRIVEPAKK